MKAVASCVLGALVSVVGALQAPFSADHAREVTSLAMTTNTESFSTFAHAAFPKHKLRIKRNDGFCDFTGVRAYTGYIDVEARHLFFYFFESRSNPAEDDVLMWINGGPGCSSTTGLFLELGPCLFVKDGLEHNPYSWNANTNLFFLDQPVGVGYSYSDHGEKVTTTEDAAVDVAAFVSIFFENFKEFKNRSFHLSGESYAGRYLPVFAAEIVDQNMRAKSEGRTPVNLQSVLIGNGYTDLALMSLSRYEMLCTTASGLDPVLPAAKCVQIKSKAPRCRKWYTDNCITSFDSISCQAAINFCGELGEDTGDRNIYDISEKCPEGGSGCGLSILSGLGDYLNRPDIRDRLGATSPGNYSGCSEAVGMGFYFSGDLLHNSRVYVEELLERGIRVLQYVGRYDLACSWVSNDWNNQDMQWSGRDEFNAKKLEPWTIDGVVVGEIKSARGLTFAILDAASHMVPIQKPAESLHMVKQFIANRHL